jgi:cell division GTPase FtsZ
VVAATVRHGRPEGRCPSHLINLDFADVELVMPGAGFALMGIGFTRGVAAQLVSNSAAVDANLIFGAVIDDALGDEVRVTVIAVGFDDSARPVSRREWWLGRLWCVVDRAGTRRARERGD